MKKIETFEDEPGDPDEEEGFWPCCHCSQDDGTHLFGCPNNIDPYQNYNKMATINSLEDAKQAVAEKHNFTDWEGFTDEGYAEYYAEAAELYMRHAVNEAVKKDRRSLVDESAMAPDNELFIDYQQVGYHDNGAKALDPVISSNILNRPLPFPEEA